MADHILTLQTKEKKKKKTNPKNDDDKCFQHAPTTALHFEEVKKDAQIISNTEPFLIYYNWKGMNYPSKIEDSKKFEKNDSTVAA